MDRARINWGEAEIIDGGKKEPRQRDKRPLESQQAAIAKAEEKRKRRAERNMRNAG